MKPALDKDTPHAAYQLGRLFAVYEQTQRAAHSFNLSAIRETMFSAACRLLRFPSSDVLIAEQASPFQAVSRIKQTLQQPD